MEKQEFSKYERARIIGARGLQIAMDAPILMKLSEKELDSLNYDPLRIAEKELDSGVLPITVNRPLPNKKEEKLEKIKVEPTSVTDEEKIKKESEEEKDISEGGEILELANQDDEDYEGTGDSNPESEEEDLD